MIQIFWIMTLCRLVHTGFWLGDPTERDYVDDLVVDGRLVLK